ncbi:MAG: hypothetical protein NTZ16_01510 [Verrucomicrobia bacterium]|nr:hypothetical protein [Verrucomicrobiota bacterium]
MKQYLITKTITAQLVVNCANKSEARKWEDRIVASLEDDSGNPIPPRDDLEFVATQNSADVRIEPIQ